MVVNCVSAGRYEVDGYVYDAAEEPKILITGKWNESMSCQPCDKEGEPLSGTELKEVCRVSHSCLLKFFTLVTGLPHRSSLTCPCMLCSVHGILLSVDYLL